MLIHANYQDFQRYVGVDSWIVGEAQASLPALTAIVRRGMTAAHRKAAADRTARFAEDHATTLAQANKAVRPGWDATQTTTGPLCRDMWEVINDEAWVLGGHTKSIPQTGKARERERV